MMEDKELIAEVVIENYVRKIITAKARNPKFFKKGDKLPKSKTSKIGIDYEWKDYTVKRSGKTTQVQYLVEIDTGERVIKNTRTAGKPRYLKITGQSLHRLTLRDYERSKIIKAIKEQMIEEVEKLEPIKHRPIIIEGELHDYYFDQEIEKEHLRLKTDWDLDNREIFYNKTFQDVLTGCREKNALGKIAPTSKVIIEDDHRGFVTQAPKLLFVPIEEGNPKIVYRIYKDNRDIIKNNKNYGNT